jgi:IclR family transcriptional regulator, acetate operon repressor
MAEPGVQSVDRALDLLEALQPGVPLGVSEIARRAQLPTGTAHRLLGTLVGRGYVRRDAERRYAPGPAALRLADVAQRELADVAHRHLTRLVDEVGETANLAVLEGVLMAYVVQVPSPHTLRIFAAVGRRVPVYSTAVGKAVLAALPDQERNRVLTALELRPVTAAAVSTIEELDAALVRVRSDGYALDDEEQEAGVRCVGVALPPASGLPAAVSVSGPSERFTAGAARRAASLVRAAAEGISADLSGRAVERHDA